MPKKNHDAGCGNGMPRIQIKKRIYTKHMMKYNMIDQSKNNLKI